MAILSQPQCVNKSNGWLFINKDVLTINPSLMMHGIFRYWPGIFQIFHIYIYQKNSHNFFLFNFISHFKHHKYTFPMTMLLFEIWFQTFFTLSIGEYFRGNKVVPLGFLATCTYQSLETTSSANKRNQFHVNLQLDATTTDQSFQIVPVCLWLGNNMPIPSKCKLKCLGLVKRE